MSNQLPPFDDDERELARLYGKLPRATPSLALDEAVLRQAREAVPATDAPASNPKSRPRHGLRWAGALAVAASLVLAANLAWQQRQLPAPQARLESAKDKAESAPAVSAGENATAPGMGGEPQPAPAVAVEGEVAARKAAQSEPVGEKAATLSQARELAKAERYVATLPPPAAPPVAPSVAAQARHASTAPRAVKTPPPPEADQALPELARTAPAQQPPESRAPPATAADALAKAAAPAPVVAAAPAPPPPPAEIGSPPPPVAAASPELAESARASIDQRPALEEISVVMGSPGDAEPRRRVAAIRQMLRDGHEASARKAYADLRRDFPGFVVPRDLAPLAK
ncbi:hypothetical protein [Pinirhizobacter soli]|uniref:hypothetical protein n=1 Tax=Pinirhizobacter soli TaxID=2786953 RepID=UPI002029DEFF|nr:hypothetical protein [Pinirhizobacter soli]